MKTSAHDETVRLPVILLAGLCGGLAEVIWAQIYTTFTGHSSVEVTRQVTASVLPGLTDAAFAPAPGIVIHFALALLVGLGYALLIWRPFLRQRGPAAAVAGAASVLASIWMMNFLVILPVLNPGFVALFPYPVSLGSKILFGLAMAGVLHTAQRADMKSVTEQAGKARRFG